MGEQSNKDMSKHFYRASAADFMKIPGNPVAYWVTENQIRMFDTYPTLTSVARVAEGSTTGDVNRFLKMWHEVSYNLIKLDSSDKDEAIESRLKWFPYNKGGEYRKWFGNNLYVINWFNNGEEIKTYPGSFVRGEKYYFRPGVTWSKVSSSALSFRIFDAGYLFDTGGLCLFGEDPNYLCGILNSKAATGVMELLAPTLNFTVGTVSSIPIIEGLESVSEITHQLRTETESDWNEFETSWCFSTNPLVAIKLEERKIEATYLVVKDLKLNSVEKVRQLEESLNDILISAYSLDTSVDQRVPIEEITLNSNPYFRYGTRFSTKELDKLLKSDTSKELVSYSIGCMMGRYSLDKPGLILASQGETIQDYLAQISSPNFTPDDDAILPLTDQEWFADDVTNRFREFVKVVWGEDTLQENLEFVAESLCLHAIQPKKSETAMESIRRYLSTQFFADHMKTYKKRPIYWLFSSGKQKAFECLVYLHRYNEGTLSRMRTEYVTPLMGKYESQIRHIEKQQETASTAEKNKLSKALKGYQSKLNELREFDNKLKHYADRRISLDLDDGVKVNYGEFGDLLAKVKEITGKAPATD